MKLKQIAKMIFYRLNRAMGRKNVYIDCGANRGEVLGAALKNLPGFEFHAFEPLEEHYDSLRKVRDHFPRESVTIHHQAVWIENEELPFYLSRENSFGERALDGSTLMSGKKAIHPNSGVVDYDNPTMVKALDFANWVISNFRKKDYIVVKMDIEGAEYPVLRHLIDTNAIDFINKMMIEFNIESNGEKRLDSITKEEHDQLVADLRTRTKLIPWH